MGEIKNGTLPSLLITHYISNLSQAGRMSHLTFCTWLSIPTPEIEIVLLKHFPDFFHFPVPYFLPLNQVLSTPLFSLILLCTGQENLEKGSELFKIRSFHCSKNKGHLPHAKRELCRERMVKTQRSTVQNVLSMRHHTVTCTLETRL